MTYNPEIYDAVTPASFLGDLEWYRGKARESGGPVLELGAGTGRITLPIARDGVKIHALDASREMLEALERKLAGEPREVQERVRRTRGDMRDFTFPERFALIIAPYRAFLHNRTEQDQLACLERVRGHLKPGGRFAFNVFHPSLEYMARNAGPSEGVWRWSETHDRPGGGYIVCSDANRYDTVRRHIHSQIRYEEYGADGSLIGTSLLRLELTYLYPADIRRLLTQVGFRTITIAGGFDGREISSDSDELVVEAV